ncbi:hypothetical protein AAC387_Pa12g0343 [Persea americana]
MGQNGHSIPSYFILETKMPLDLSLYSSSCSPSTCAEPTPSSIISILASSLCQPCRTPTPSSTVSTLTLYLRRTHSIIDHLHPRLISLPNLHNSHSIIGSLHAHPLQAQNSLHHQSSPCSPSTGAESG